jgi:MoxR-like ATPase
MSKSRCQFQYKCKDKRMFDSINDLASKLAATGYLIDPVMTQVVFLAAKLQKPLLLEGPAGSGKTQLAVSVAVAAKTHVERLQCYRGVTEDKAIGRFDESLQRLYMEFSKGQHENWRSVQENLKGRDFFRPGPLMRALECERPCVLLIDELDKVDDGFEAMLLEILSAWQLSQWYMLSFEGCEDQFTSEKFDRAFCEYDLFRLVEQPGLLLSEFQPAIA